MDSVILDDSGTVDKIERFYPQGYSVDSGIGHFVNKIEEFNITINPQYQRDLTWNTWQYEKFLGYFIRGGPTPRIIIHRDCDFDYHEVIDGQHRVAAFSKWVGGHIGAIIGDNSKIYYNQLTDRAKRGLPLVNMFMVNLPLIERVELYLELNEGGVVHGKLHLMSVRNMLTVMKRKVDHA